MNDPSVVEASEAVTAIMPEYMEAIGRGISQTGREPRVPPPKSPSCAACAPLGTATCGSSGAARRRGDDAGAHRRFRRRIGSTWGPSRAGRAGDAGRFRTGWPGRILGIRRDGRADDRGEAVAGRGFVRNRSRHDKINRLFGRCGTGRGILRPPAWPPPRIARSPPNSRRSTARAVWTRRSGPFSRTPRRWRSTRPATCSSWTGRPGMSW